MGKMDCWGSNSQSNGPWLYSTPLDPESAKLSPEEDWKVAMYREENAKLKLEVRKLQTQVEFLRECLQKAQHDHDLDYQLFLLRDKTKSPPRLPVFPVGNGYEAVAEKVASSLQRAKKPRGKQKSPRPTTPPEGPDSDPELAATLSRLLAESTRAACAQYQ